MTRPAPAGPGPIPTGGRSTVLGVGAAAQLLTEYAVPDQQLMVINISTDLAWIAGDSSVGPSNGVPLEPGTAIPWTAGGSVWAVADTAAAAAVTVYITSAISGWTPSPAAIAAEVAAELLAEGVPNVIVEDDLGIFTNLAAGSSLPLLDVHKYASLLIGATTSTISQSSVVQFDWFSANNIGGVLGIGDVWSTPQPPVGGLGSNIIHQDVGTLEVLGPWLGITNKDPNGNPVTLHVVGSNRPAIRSIDTNNRDGIPLDFSAPSPQVVGTTQMTMNTNTQKIEGPVWGEFDAGGTASVGIIQLVYLDPTGVQRTMNLADTTEMATHAGNRFIWKSLALPRCGFYLQFACTTAGSGSVSARFISAR